MIRTTFAVAAIAAFAGSAQAQVTVGVDPSAGAGGGSTGWLGFMNVSELPANGGAFVFPSSWGVADLRAEFDDANNELELFPNSINDPDPFWYTPAGGPGSTGNKIMEANLFQQVTNQWAGQTLTFEGTILSNDFTAAHETSIFIRDFAPDFSSFNETTIPMTPGPFSLSLALDAGADRNVQWGFQVKGENVWITDIDPFGSAVIATPAPGSLALLAAGGLVAARRRRA